MNQGRVEFTHTRFHSHDWETLVERGWTTMCVEPNPQDGVRIAVMTRTPKKSLTYGPR